MLLGDKRVGKTSMLQQAFLGKFDDYNPPKRTVGFEHKDIQIEILEPK